jgi:hypothetical protein
MVTTSAGTGMMDVLITEGVEILSLPDVTLIPAMRSMLGLTQKSARRTRRIRLKSIEELLQDPRMAAALEALLNNTGWPQEALPELPKGYVYTGEFRLPVADELTYSLDYELWSPGPRWEIPVWIVRPADTEAE